MQMLLQNVTNVPGTTAHPAAMEALDRNNGQRGSFLLDCSSNDGSTNAAVDDVVDAAAAAAVGVVRTNYANFPSQTNNDDDDRSTSRLLISSDNGGDNDKNHQQEPPERPNTAKFGSQTAVAVCDSFGGGDEDNDDRELCGDGENHAAQQRQQLLFISEENASATTPKISTTTTTTAEVPPEWSSKENRRNMDKCNSRRKNKIQREFNDQQHRQSSKQPFFGRFRFCIALLMMLATYSYTSMRMNLSMAIVCMVNTTAVHIKEAETAARTSQNKQLFIKVNETQEHFIDEEEDDQCTGSLVSGADVSKSKGYQGTLEWSNAQQARLFGATFYGSFFTVWFSGYLADRFGPKFLMGLAMADFTLVTWLTPWLVSIDYNVFFAARVFMGFGEGFVMPTLSAACARWFPPSERSLMIAICTLGNQFAALVALLLSSRLCALQLLGGWPTIFYAFGLMGTLCVAMWFTFGSNNPKESRWIGRKERDMITASLTHQQTAASKGLVIPWRQMATSMPLYAGILGQSNYIFCNVILQAYLPTYFKDVVQLDLKSNGLFSVIPFVGMACSKIFMGIGSDLLRKHNILSGTNAVKLCQSIACFGAAFAAICIGWLVNCNTPGLAAFFMAIWGISYGANTSGFLTLMLSIAPRFSGTIASMSTAISIVVSGISPMVVSTVVKQGNASEWRLIWYLMAACNLFCAVFFLVFASAKQQKWSIIQQQSLEDVKNGDDGRRRPKLTKIIL